MVTSNFEYFAPESFDEAASLLAKHRDTAKILAGGHSLLPIMKLRLAAPEVLIDISNVPELSEISSNGDGLTIGAMATYYELSQSAAVQAAAPAIAEAAGQVADVQVRNRGTIGGSLSHSDPAGDMPAVFLALNGSVVARTRRGTREIASDRFFVDLLTTALRPTEIVTQIKIPAASGNTGSAYAKFENKASHYAIAGVAAQVTVGSDGTVSAARVAVTGVSSKSSRAKDEKFRPVRDMYRSKSPGTVENLKTYYFIPGQGHEEFKNWRQLKKCLRCFSDGHLAKDCRTHREPIREPCRLCCYLFHRTERCHIYNIDGTKKRQQKN